MEKDNLVCKRYNDAGECVEFSLIEGKLVGKISEEAKVCNPELAKEAEKLIREGKIEVKL